jgi:hypothetical protein
VRWPAAMIGIDSRPALTLGTVFGGKQVACDGICTLLSSQKKNEFSREEPAEILIKKKGEVTRIRPRQESNSGRPDVPLRA